MTQSVADNKTWRRHTDPPGLWIVVMMGSVVLHLLLFWLIRSSEFARSQQQSSNAVPIEFIETTPKARAKTRPNSTAKLVSPNPKSPTRQSVSTRLTKRVTRQSVAAKTSSSTKDSNTIAFAKTKESNTLYSKTQVVSQKPLKKPTGVQKTVSPKTKSRTKPEPLKSEPTFSPDIADNTEPNFRQSPDIPDNRSLQPITSPRIPHNRRTKRFIKNPLPKNSPQTVPPPNQVSQDLSRSEQQDLASRPPDPPEPTTTPSSPLTNKLSGTTSSPQPNSPGGSTKLGQGRPLVQPGRGIAFATLTVEQGGIKKDIPDNPAKPKTDQILWKCPALETGSNVKPKDLEVYFDIDNKRGKVLGLTINDNDLENLPAEEKIQYRKCAEENFVGRELFTQATTNGKPPDKTTQVLRIIIKHN